ncbi:SRPBCC family protein [Candidatus Marinimicrobia bacterium]|jgi:ligand-binding SRPBCC domain-containing protein|nr:SRPBCC family protein [Candidatus Neomarinimicrobiota bacterium]|tara:strand:- start:540 stop:1019 length:480 start_codon:yes stop_codon:yes gene_type:complete
MKTYKIEYNQFIDLPIEDVFNFFSKPENLSLITPPRMNFEIMTPQPLEMKEGQLVDYALTIAYVIKLRWRTLITKYESPHIFIDQQIKGPYSLWHHTHTFEEKDGGTIIKDSVVYAIPFGLLGRFVHAIYIKYDIQLIFKHRKKILTKIFKNIKKQAKA